LFKNLQVKESLPAIKIEANSKPNRLVDGDYEISGQMDGMAIDLKTRSVKKV
jgi:uncharacterized Zn ribbon protein